MDKDLLGDRPVGVLAERWKSIRAAVETEPGSDDHTDNTDLAVRLALRLAPHKKRHLSEDELDYLAAASTHDDRLIRHLRAWALGARSDEVRETRLDEVRERIFSEDGTTLQEFEWSSRTGMTLASKLISGVDVAGLIGTHNRLARTLAAIAELDPAMGETPAGLSWLTRALVEVAEQVTVDLHTSANSQPIDDFDGALGFLPMSVLDRETTAGLAAGHELYRSGRQRTAEAVANVLNKDPHLVEDSLTCGIALLWADLRQLSDYQSNSRQNRNEIRGVLARLSAHQQSYPDAWVSSARTILDEVTTVGRQVVDLLVTGAVQHDSIRTELDRIAGEDWNAVLRDRVQGLLTRITGWESPDEDTRRWLADTAARSFDGIPLFPNPLTPLARTWPGSVDLETTLSSAIRQAMTRFAGYAKTQGGVAVEETMTGVLLNDLEYAFVSAKVRLVTGKRSPVARMISVSQRVVHKTIEEPRWGCDVALLLNADMRPDAVIEVAELVQIKKSDQFKPKGQPAPQEKWRIDLPQLTTILDRSQSATYWLILSTGEVLCVPARWLHGMAHGRAAVRQRKSMTVGYHEVRHAAVPMEQFLSELFLGTWVGTASEPTLAFARGDDVNVSPRHIFEISVVTERDQSNDIQQ